VGEGPQAVLHHAGIGQLPSGAGGQLPEKLDCSTEDYKRH